MMVAIKNLISIRFQNKVYSEKSGKLKFITMLLKILFVSAFQNLLIFIK